MWCVYGVKHGVRGVCGMCLCVYMSMCVYMCVHMLVAVHVCGSACACVCVAIIITKTFQEYLNKI